VSAALSVQGLTAGYDRTMVLRDLSVAVNPGQTAVVIGPNGHGKTTLLLAISGLLKPSAGTIEFDGRRIDGTAAERLADRGIVHILQGDGLFPDMTVEENLLLGAFLRGSWRGRRASLRRVYDDLPVVEEKRGQKARTLSGGERRLVGLGRGMMRPARLLLIDEPSLGLAPVRVDEVYDAIRRIVASGVSVVVVEQDVERALAIADRAYLLGEGRVVTSGPAASMRASEEVRRSVLGL